MEAFKKILKNRRTLVFMDFEGTQFSHEIIAIGLVKTTCDENGIINGPYQTYKRYVKSYGPIGKIVTRITSITPEIIKNEGVTLEQALDEIKIFLGDEYENTAFIAFGSNDVKMIIDSIKLSKPSNDYVGLEMCKHSIDFLAFLSQFIKDDKGNNYSLVNYLKLYDKDPYGTSHDPLNDAIDLMNLYQVFMNEKEIRAREYINVIKKQKVFPSPIKKIINKLLNDEVVTPEDFKKEIAKYVE
jgi:DNA polymerase III epsilon subunit-like protein